MLVKHPIKRQSVFLYSPCHPSPCHPFYVVKQEAGDLFLFFLLLYGKSEEEVSSAGEQLTSNRVYDGENTREGLS